MITIRRAALPEDRDLVFELFAEYLPWICARIYQEYQLVFDPESILAHDMAHLDRYLPPAGFLLLAFDSGALAGCAGARRHSPDIGELKRMYVRPEFRGKGIGRQLLVETLRAAQSAGFARLRLDSARFMHAAHSLYRSAGFAEIAPYKGSEVPIEHSSHWFYMELDLTGSQAG